MNPTYADGIATGVFITITAVLLMTVKHWRPPRR